eukprot:CAMPEP_0194445772 /NCGR_PEP_ID=MMETSP0176-20130528/128054_1 /TAXON_ID=216777 /ORGANISM="Proboscia alata, Strain PI-D3" /LENGTH=84 /DNA_ID=CAMNT_0039272377 /DNA_START=402 /DNA_END=656 /DNA_ORIENTATION=-
MSDIGTSQRRPPEFVPTEWELTFISSRIEEAMSEKGTSQRRPPEFVPTHPPHDYRLSNLDDWIPTALDIFYSEGRGRDKMRANP